MGPKESGIIRLATDIEAYFQAEVQSVSAKQGVDLSPFAVNYLGKVLGRFTDARRYLQTTGPAPGEAKEKRSYPTLALLWLEGLSKTSHEQLQQFQQLGDVALFTSGFFAERINRSLVDMDYYIAMGGKAYERAGHLRDSIQAERSINIFFELASTFEGVVEVFSEISDKSMLGNDKDLLRLYEKWMSTRSERLRRMLGEEGVIAGTGSPDGES